MHTWSSHTASCTCYNAPIVPKGPRPARAETAKVQSTATMQHSQCSSQPIRLLVMHSTLAKLLGRQPAPDAGVIRSGCSVAIGLLQIASWTCPKATQLAAGGVGMAAVRSYWGREHRACCPGIWLKLAGVQIRLPQIPPPAEWVNLTKQGSNAEGYPRDQTQGARDELRALHPWYKLYGRRPKSKAPCLLPCHAESREGGRKSVLAPGSMSTPLGHSVSHECK